MNLDEIKELIAVMRKNKIKEVDLEQKGVKMRLVAMDDSREVTYIAAPQQVQMIPQVAAAPVALPAAPVAAPAPAAVAAAPEVSGVEVKSPMVGTFYRSPSPDAPVYAEVGTVVNKDSVLCIIEAMKLMNEIKSEVRGKIVKVLVENGQPVEYNQPLFIVEPF